MSELILHHYDTSPFSEKIRLIFGRKGLAWRSALQPNIMPKPELVPLTGGYRRIPVLQIGADVYCDSQRIARELERLHPRRRSTPTAARASATRSTCGRTACCSRPRCRWCSGRSATRCRRSSSKTGAS